MTTGLDRALRLRNGDEVEYALVEAFRQGLTGDHLSGLIQLLGKSWHSRHEDVVLALQQLKAPKAVQSLIDATRKAYPQYYDDGLALIRKCTWALADIGTAEAKEGLRALSGSTNSEVAAYASKRLEKWDLERGRKGA